MIANLRVGIPLTGGRSWLGGVSHMELHVKAVTALSKAERPELYLILLEGQQDQLQYYLPFIHCFDGLLILAQSNDISLPTLPIPVFFYHSEQDLFEQIDFYFPVSFNTLHNQCSASWIHDFQHYYFPELFSPQEVQLRNELCHKVAAEAKLVFCSSYSVETDFRKFHPYSKAITKVLPLRILPESKWFEGNPWAVQTKYHLPDAFILCCNQFWQHKNHRLLFDALALLHRSGQEIHLVCTGATEDFRRPEYFSELQDYIRDLGLQNFVHILGIIPREDQIQLIRRSLFVVQPSLFEGLSLIVQECRALGKSLVLSDLPVHLEHEYGIYFQRSNVEDLTVTLAALLSQSSPGPDINRETEAKLQAPVLVKNYAKQFCEFTEKAVSLFNQPASPYSSTSPKNLVLATSINSQGDLEVQRMALDSWKRLGFEVISINSSKDQELLNSLFPDITFTLPRSSNQTQSCVTLNDLLHGLSQSSATVYGIAPADVYLGSSFEPDLICKEAQGSLVYCEKTPQQSITSCSEPLFSQIGCIFFDPALSALWQELNDPLDHLWWDYDLLFQAFRQAVPLKKLLTSCAYHLNHLEDFSLQDWADSGQILAQSVRPSFTITAESVSKLRHVLAELFNKHSIPLTLKRESRV